MNSAIEKAGSIEPVPDMSQNPTASADRIAASGTSEGQEFAVHPDLRFPNFQRKRREHWQIVHDLESKKSAGQSYYHAKLRGMFRFAIAPGQRVLELGSGEGDLLASLQPSRGVGLDFSETVVERAQQKHPDLQFRHLDAHGFELGETFDAIILSDLINDVWDVQTILRQVARHSNPRTRIFINFFSQLWKAPLGAVRNMGMATPLQPQNWLTIEDLTNLLDLAGFEVVRSSDEIVFPLGIPIVSTLANRYLARLWPFRLATLTHFVVARPKPRELTEDLTVSVVVAARNEAGNIDEIFARTPEIGAGTELIFVEGGSTDNTFEVLEKAIADRPNRNAKLFRQTGIGKGDAVRKGFSEATGDVLMILDADLTVPPEDLPRFYDALVHGNGEFINGVRLVYPMDEKAMRFFNLVGNKFFSMVFSWLLGQPIKDTLCGTKVLRKSDYELIAKNRSYFGDFDPFGDFDLIFGAAKQNLRIAEMPIRYGERTYGDTNISRWKHGLMLLKMVIFAATRLKFV